MKPEMKHCAACGAPNPERLRSCYACGRLLEQPAPAPTQTYPCRACEQPIPFAAPLCPHCGLAVQPGVPTEESVRGMAPEDLSRVAGALQSAATLGSIGDWEILPLPDGTTVLKRGFWGRLTRAGATSASEALAVFALLFCGAICSRLAFPRHAEPRPQFLVLAGFWAVALLLLLIWMVFASEQLRVGPQLLERRRALGRLARVQRWEGAAGATFRVSQYETSGRDGHHSYRRLQVSGRQGWAVLDSHEVTAFSSTHNDEARALGQFLSQLTGWPLLGF